MSTLSKKFARIGNRIGVWLYPVFDGREKGGKQARALLLTVPGRRTGVPRSTCVAYLETPDGYVVWGTGSGARTDPDWFRNLRRATKAEVRIGARRFTATPRELKGAERDAVWNDVIVAQLPSVQRYARKAGRTIPVALLAPVRPR